MENKYKNVYVFYLAAFLCTFNLFDIKKAKI